ncbi:hypothetical protein PFICI_07159 [Pestalotiopsis fici W106-1]|uniref:Beta-glucuronidase C-terminal domain-containing protein n=1 Tax=Pestalotiopsis fici (strain W106-1 / CGMCC3.15140) TaxID=1229662 RepID=W3X9S2_PESFW|nr:uncharacterized protein PFICI_07159 [Pestalotiopsis fici W106-1]ETS82157.1 hypothetical protein PFICI_07159 [Pestalotiopsis fici W106-1]
MASKFSVSPIAMAFLAGLGSAADVLKLNAPTSLAGASIEHLPSFSPLSIEPAFWVEFVGNASEPNELYMKLISNIVERGGQPIIRPGGNTMDSMIFDSNGGDPVRTMGTAGEVYRTTVGPAYYESWANFPDEVLFISTLNFGNDSLQIAQDLAVASVKYQAERVKSFELGNEPNWYPSTRWNYSTDNYVSQWKNWTASIDQAIDTAAEEENIAFPDTRWVASSATTDDASIQIRPVNIIPAGIDSENQVQQYSIHSYVYNTCSAAGAAISTIENLLNHTRIITFAVERVLPSATAALESGKQWIMGEFNSVACSGKPNVTDTFTQALWVIDTELTYATLNASSVHLHQGATLVLQSSTQTNTPGYSAYSWVYPRDSDKWGEARALPSYAAMLFLAEVFAQPKTRVLSLEAAQGVDQDRFSAYATYVDDKLSKIILLNLEPYYSNSTSDFTINLDISEFLPAGNASASVKRLTAPSVDEQDTSQVLWAGQSFKYGDASGNLTIEKVSASKIVNIRGSEAILVEL